MTSERAGLMLTLLDPVIASQDAASAGTPETLSFIPGAALLGAFASCGYTDFEQCGLAFDLFHSGAMRFGDALPVDRAGRVGFPAPASLHYARGEGDALKQALNLARQTPDGARAPLRQCREEAVSLCGARIAPARTGALKTAIDPETGRAMDAQLFGIEALAADQRFWAELSADDPELLSRIRKAVPDGSVLRLGRSRSAEFGRVRADWTEAPPLPGIAPEAEPSRERPLLIWALADIALDPEAGGRLEDALGLESGTRIDPARSFARLRRVWPYNSHWRARGPERLTMRRGSVIALQAGPALRGLTFLGLNREIGCGRSFAAPALLDASVFAPEQAARAPTLECRASTSEAGGSLFRLMAARRTAAYTVQGRIAAAEGALMELGRLYEAAADLAGADMRTTGPAPSQWSAVRAAAWPRPDRDAVFGTNGVASDEDAVWGASVGVDMTFRSWLADQWEATREDPERLALIAKGAAEASRHLRDSGEWRVRL